MLDSYTPLSGNQVRLYYALREAIPIIDAAIFKLVRLTGGFEVKCADKRCEKVLERFIQNVEVGGNQHGLDAFIATYFEQLLTCGTAVGEMVTDASGRI
ncbi:MAG: serine/threonine protein phosphatase, partial [Acutalibacteraceae bacterium]